MTVTEEKLEFDTCLLCEQRAKRIFIHNSRGISLCDDCFSIMRIGTGLALVLVELKPLLDARKKQRFYCWNCGDLSVVEVSNGKEMIPVCLDCRDRMLGGRP